MSDQTGARGECILCGATDRKMTLEHVYGDWITEQLPDSTRERRRILVEIDRETGEAARSEHLEPDYWTQQQLKVLCGECNNVWGSEIESAAKRVLPELLHGRVVSVLDSGARAIATWAMKVAIIREFRDPANMRGISRQQRHYFRITGEPPPGTLILAAPIWRRAQYWPKRTRHRPLSLQIDDGIIHDANGHLTTLGLGRVAIFVIGWPVSETPFDLSDWMLDTFVRLWPEPRSFTWPPPESLTDEELDILSGDDPGAIFRPPEY